MRCHNCGTENDTSARFCRNCGAALACTNCRSPLGPGDRFCANCGYPVPQTVQERQQLAQDQQPAPLHEVERIHTGDIASDRKLVTSLFADVVGSTAIAETMDPEDWTAIMNRAFELLSPPIIRYEGTITRLLGDALLALFGAPVSHEDDPTRAVYAALDLIDAARDYAAEVRQRFGVEFAIRVGVNTGLVVVGNIGSDLKTDYTAIGDAVNVAARLQGLARPMSVLISESTRRFVHTAFELNDLGEVEVKGKAQSVRVYEVVGRKAMPGARRGIAGLDSPLIGRDTELATLAQLTAAVQAGLGRIALIIGEPGLGKSRLVSEWKSTNSVRVAQGECLSYGRSIAYHLGASLLRSILGIPLDVSKADAQARLRTELTQRFGAQDMEVYPYLSHLLGLPLEGEAERQVAMLDPQMLSARYTNAVRRLLLAESAHAPLALILEDVHWADPSSVELLNGLFPLVRQARLLFCLTLRPEPETPGWQLVTSARALMGISLAEIQLQPLSETHSGELVSNLLEIQALPEAIRTLILSRAEGNPFFVEEIIRALIESGTIMRQDGRWIGDSSRAMLDVPDTLVGLLLTRIDRQPEAARHVLRIASVVGRRFSVRVLEQVLAPDEATTLAEQLSILEAAGLIQLAQIEPELAYEFRHALVEDAAYASLLKRDRQRLHRAVGAALEALHPDRLTELAPALGHHFAEAGERESAGKYLALSGESAAHRYANIEAIGFYDRALEVTREQDTVRVALYHARGLLHERVGNFDLARADYEASLETAQRVNDHTGQWRALIDLGALWAARDYQQTGRYYQQAHALAQAMGDKPRLASTLNRIGNWYANRDKPHEGKRFHQQALRLYEDMNDRAGILETIDVMAITELLAGNYCAGQDLFQKTAALARELDNQQLLSTALAEQAAMIPLHDAGLLPPARPLGELVGLAEMGIRIARSIGWRSGEAFATGVYGILLGRTGDFARGFEAMHQALDIARSIGHIQWTLAIASYMGLTYNDYGLTEKAVEVLEPLVEPARFSGSTYWIRIIAGMLALAYVQTSALEQAGACIDQAISPEDRPDTLAKRLLWHARIELMLAQGQPELAMDLIDQLFEHLSEVDARGENGVWTIAYLRGKALIARMKAANGATPEKVQQAETALRAAEQMTDEYHIVGYLWRVRAALAELYRLTGRSAEANAEAARAWNVVERIAATVPDNEQRELVRRYAGNVIGHPV